MCIRHSVLMRVALAFCYLGYACVCVNVTCEGSEKPKAVTAFPDLAQSVPKEKNSKTPKKAKLYTAAIGNGLQLKDTGIKDSKELPRQRKRITFKLEEVADAQRLLRVDVVKGYDVVAVEAMTLKVFQFLCEQADIDLITFDVTNRIPFQMKRPLIAAAIKRGIYFEITYVPCLGDSAGRRYFFSNASNLVRLTGGRNLGSSMVKLVMRFPPRAWRCWNMQIGAEELLEESRSKTLRAQPWN